MTMEDPVGSPLGRCGLRAARRSVPCAAGEPVRGPGTRPALVMRASTRKVARWVAGSLPPARGAARQAAGPGESARMPLQVTGLSAPENFASGPACFTVSSIDTQARASCRSAGSDRN